MAPLTPPGASAASCTALCFGPDAHIEDEVPIVKGGDVSPERLRLNLLSRTAAEIECRYERSRLHTGDLVVRDTWQYWGCRNDPRRSYEGANLTQDAARVGYGQGYIRVSGCSIC